MKRLYERMVAALLGMCQGSFSLACTADERTDFDTAVQTAIAATMGAQGQTKIPELKVGEIISAQGPESQGKYPQGHWMTVGMCIGIVIGCVPSLAGILFDPMSSFVAIGPAMGCGLGVALGAALERKHKDEIHPLTEEEKRLRSRTTFVGLGALALLVVSLFVVGGIVMFAPR